MILPNVQAMFLINLNKNSEEDIVLVPSFIVNPVRECNAEFGLADSSRTNRGGKLSPMERCLS